MAGELLGDPFVHASLSEHRHVRVAHVMDAAVLYARRAEDAVP
jgi:hypothetical protein